MTDKTLAEALAAGEDATGLGTVRDLARAMLEEEANGRDPWIEMWFDLDGKAVNLEAAVTFVDDKPKARQWSPLKLTQQTCRHCKYWFQQPEQHDGTTPYSCSNEVVENSMLNYEPMIVSFEPPADFGCNQFEAKE